ncbi:hypothetical protein FRC03_005224 [Tulasnella sp. 419]|nr:hypothetical protein FRC03_005224 [Tulasnella sp. 419]
MTYALLLLTLTLLVHGLPTTPMDDTVADAFRHRYPSRAIPMPLMQAHFQDRPSSEYPFTMASLEETHSIPTRNIWSTEEEDERLPVVITKRPRPMRRRIHP